MPVLLLIEPGRLGLPDTEAGVAELSRVFPTAVANGLRAELEIGSLLTGSLYVSLAMFPDAPPATIGTFAGRETVPSVAGGQKAIELRVSRLLDKLNALPVETMLDRVDLVLADFGQIVGSESMQGLPASLEATLVDLRDVLESVSANSALQERLLRTTTELNRTLQSLRAFLTTLDEKPNSLIFSRDAPEDPEPPAGAP
jgi:paraquat-inducible protein B